MPQRGFRLIFQHVSETTPGQRGTTIATWVVIGMLALIAVALWTVPWNTIFPLAPAPAPVPVAHVQPAPSPTITPTQIIQVNGSRGAICVVPTSRVRRPVTLVKVP